MDILEVVAEKLDELDTKVKLNLLLLFIFNAVIYGLKMK